ncbi:hypothetical protein M3N64_05615 [Sporolactobacillus sp. CPB3-1]|uniref:Polymer-forming cytoskeletal protein n=1 Tax=Sporolactobacillus mangiferae TaxID=2940498 RepID=A0ABT0MAX5_9BACL|nr:hypothetical protein [Sporolactobacillus mangiferae]MCL1631429.1 hypothetical protein [Sporolactobacillus mangiferae]
MSQERKSDFRVMGESHSGGGAFDKVRIMGECTINGSLEANSCKVMGECVVKGDLSCDYFKNMGEVSVDGRFAAGEARFMGETRIGGDCMLRQSSIYGQLFAGKNLTGDNLKVRGTLQATGDVSLESLEMHGGIYVAGLLNCDEANIAVKFRAENYVKEIGAGRVTVRRKRSWFNAAPVKRFRAEIIEGDYVHLEYTEASVVRGSVIEIGDGCKIDRVEYSGAYKTNGTFEVGKVIRTELKNTHSEEE